MKLKNLLIGLKKKAITLIVISLVVFAAYFLVHYYQIFSKGYPLDISSTNLIVARNLHLADSFSVEDERNVFLSSELVAEKGQRSNLGNRITPLFYRYVFDIFGFSVSLPLFVSLFFWSLSAVFIFLILYRLFGLGIGLIGVGIDILLPNFWITSTTAGFYEVAILFFVMGLFFYLKRKKYFYLLLASCLFAVAILARNAFIVSFAAIVIFEFYQSNFKISKKLLFLVLPA